MGKIGKPNLIGLSGPNITIIYELNDMTPMSHA